MRTGSAFGGSAFWAALRECDVEREVRALYLDAKLTLRRKGGLPMQAGPPRVSRHRAEEVHCRLTLRQLWSRV